MEKEYILSFHPPGFAENILRKGRIISEEETPAQMVERMVRALFEPEERFGTPSGEIKRMMDEFGEAAYKGNIVMSTPIMTNAGRYNDKALSACTVPPVNLQGDLRVVKQMIDRFHEDGMGTGFNLSDTDDPVRVLKSLNQIAIEGANSGREDRPVGNMAILSVHHPKILEFIEAKVGADSRGEEWRFNISVDASDDFMNAVLKNGEYTLLDGTRLNAKEVFLRIAESAVACGGPGLIFLDRMNRDNPTPGVGSYISTAPCAEVGLAPGESCQFGYINLARFVTGYTTINLDLLERITRLMTRVLDNALEISIERYPDSTNQRVMKAKRKIGVGICGLADLLVILQIPYDSQEARQLATDLIAFINFVSKNESYELAKTRGSFGAMNLPPGENRYRENPGFLERKYGLLETKYVTVESWRELGARIRETGLMRNASTMALPPTGRSALVIGASTGIEPLFSLINPDGSINPYLLPVVKEYGLDIGEILRIGRIGHLDKVPESIRRIFRTALEISPEDHLAMVANIQRAVDDSIAKTINTPRYSTANDFMFFFKKAYLYDLKGITIY